MERRRSSHGETSLSPKGTPMSASAYCGAVHVAETVGSNHQNREGFRRVTIIGELWSEVLGGGGGREGVIQRKTRNRSP